jgi:hypothetical protein
MDPTAGPQNSQPPSTQWDALLSVQKENARLRRILAADKPPPAPTGRKRPPPRGAEQDELQSDEESDAVRLLVPSWFHATTNEPAYIGTR